MDNWGALQQGFVAGLQELLDRDGGVAKELDQLTREVAWALGREGARSALAPLVWSSAIGDRWDVRQATEFLDVTRQALYKRVRNGTALGVRGRGTTYFPVWQFDLRQRIIRAVTGQLLHVFRDADPDIDPLVIAAWAIARNPELNDRSPADLIIDGQDVGPVLDAAHRAARPLAA